MQHSFSVASMSHALFRRWMIFKLQTSRRVVCKIESILSGFLASSLSNPRRAPAGGSLRDDDYRDYSGSYRDDAAAVQAAARNGCAGGCCGNRCVHHPGKLSLL